MLDRKIGLPGKQPKDAAHIPAVGITRVERERTFDQSDHGADFPAEIRQYVGGVGENARVIPPTWSAFRVRSPALRRDVSGSSAQPSVASRRWQIAAQESAGP